MNSYPSELRTPPLPLIAFIGCSDLHRDLSVYFSQTLRPPLVSIGIAEASDTLLTRLFGAGKAPKPYSHPEGILKADWFLKQRQRRAAVALVLVNRSDVEGDPTSWKRVAGQLQMVAGAAARGQGRLLAVLQPAGAPPELPHDRLGALAALLGVETTSVFLLQRDLFSGAPEQQPALHAALRPLGGAVMEAAASYYAAAAERQRAKQLDLSSSLGSVPPAINVRVAFKLAVYAEFRQDWLTAVSCYQTAYAALRGVPLGSPLVSPQMHAEVVAVAEVVHFKVLNLLLHQQALPQALGQLREHLGLWGPVPEGFPPAAAAAHRGWLARQYTAAAEMLAARNVDAATLQDCRPGYLALAAAHLGVARRAALEEASAAAAAGAGPPPLAWDPGSVRKGPWLGQVVRRSDTGAVIDLTDAEYCCWLAVEEGRAPLGPAAVDAIRAALGHFGEAGSGRLRGQLLLMLAQQHLDTANLLAARKGLLAVAHCYRRDGWPELLLQVLLQLRDTCARLKLHKEALLAGLELAALLAALGRARQQRRKQQQQQGIGQAGAAQQQQQQQLLDPSQTAALATAAFSSLLVGGTDKKGGIIKTGLSPVSSNSGSPLPDAASALPPGATAATDKAPSSSSSSSPQPPGHLEYQVMACNLAAALAAPSTPPGAPGGGGGSSGGAHEAPVAPSVADVLLRHHQEDAGWLTVVSIAGGFQAAPLDPAVVYCCIALYNHLPVPLPLSAVDVMVRDEQGAWAAAACCGPPPAPGTSSTDHASSQQAAGEAAAALSGLSLGAGATPPPTGTSSSISTSSLPLHQVQVAPGTWLQLHVPLQPRCLGLLAAERLVLHLSAACSVTVHIASFPRGPLLGGGVLPAPEVPWRAAQGVRPGVWAASVAHVGPLPAVQVHVPELCLVGEWAPLQLVVGGGPGRLAGGAVVELSVRSPTGAIPGGATLMGRLPSAPDTLETLSMDRTLITLPPLVPGTPCIIPLWLCCPLAATSIKVSAVLACPHPVAASAVVTYEDPFLAWTRLSGEVGCHTLAGPSTTYAAAAAAPPVAGDGDAAAAAAGQAVLALRGLPLVIGQAVIAQVLVRCSQPVHLQLVGAKLLAEDSTGVQVCNDVGQQLGATGLPLSGGTLQTLLLHLMPTALTSSASTEQQGRGHAGFCSLGRLLLRWKRVPSAPTPAAGGGVSTSGTTAGSHSSSSSSSSSGPVVVPPGPEPAAEVTTAIELPEVRVGEGQLVVSVSGPPTATAGLAFPFTCQMHNTGATPQQLQLSMGECPGFVVSGDQQRTLVVGPRAREAITWTLVAHASGALHLPPLAITAPKLNSSLVTQPALVNVLAF